MKVIIYARNQPYGERLYNYLLRKKNQNFKFFLATSHESFRDILEDEKAEGVVLEKALAQDFENLPKTLFLVNQISENPREICKFQGGTQIYEKIVEGFGKDLNEEGKIIIAVFSPSGKVDASEFALEICKEHARYGKVLYLPLTQFPVLLPAMQEGLEKLSEEGMSKLIFELGQIDFNKAINELSFSYEKITVVAPFWHFKDLLDLDQKEIKHLLELARETKEYRTIVIEIGQLFEYALETLQLVDRVIVPMSDSEFDRTRLNVLFEYCRMEGKEDLYERLEIMIEEKLDEEDYIEL